MARAVVFDVTAQERAEANACEQVRAMAQVKVPGQEMLEASVPEMVQAKVPVQERVEVSMPEMVEASMPETVQAMAQAEVPVEEKEEVSAYEMILAAEQRMVSAKKGQQLQEGMSGPQNGRGRHAPQAVALRDRLAQC